MLLKFFRHDLPSHSNEELTELQGIIEAQANELHFLRTVLKSVILSNGNVLPIDYNAINEPASLQDYTITTNTIDGENVLSCIKNN